MGYLYCILLGTKYISCRRNRLAGVPSSDRVVTINTEATANHIFSWPLSVFLTPTPI